MDSSRNPTQLIDNKSAKILCENFIKEKADIIERQYKMQDANAFWFSLEELESYLDYIKKQGEELKLDINGVRIYLGSYSRNTNQKNDGLTTVFITPTKKSTTEKSSHLGVGSGDGPKEQSDDATEISSLNYGGIGNPPQIVFDY